jgi:hypothetical protein
VQLQTTPHLEEIDFERDSLTHPPAEIADYVTRLVAVDRKGVEKRSAHRFPLATAVPVMPIDDRLRPVGRPFMALTRNISTCGIALVHTRPVTTKYLVVELTSAADERLQVLLEVLRCRPLGPYCDIAGEFVAKVTS